MSPLPERRKSAEELAALRESLGVPSEPTDDAPPPAEKLKSAVFEPPSEPVPPPERQAKPVRSLRKSERLPVDQPKKVTAGKGALPVRRHTDKELNQLRKIEAPAAVPPAVHLASMTASPGWLLLFYGLGLALATLAFFGPWGREAAGFALLMGAGAVMLGGALWLRLRRPRSQHHAGFLTLIAVLVLVFGTLYFIPEIHAA